MGDTMIEFERKEKNGPDIHVVGVGGGGGNAINNMIEHELAGVTFIAANTDCQSLEMSQASVKVRLGSESTRGLGAGARPEVGLAAAKESIDQIEDTLTGADMTFIAAGMGGGTGTGAAPIVAEVARKKGALTVGVVTKPFSFEGARRRKQAEEGIRALSESVDTLIVVPNDRLLEITAEETSMLDAFKLADQVLYNAVKGISDIITQKGVLNVDFADAVSVMSGQGRALMGIGRSKGKNRAEEAAKMAVSSPLLENVSVDGATGILVNVTGGATLTLHEVNSAIHLITDAADDDANIIFGYVVDETMGDEIAITVIATGFENAEQRNAKSELKTKLAHEHAGALNSTQEEKRRNADVPAYLRKSWEKNTSPLDSDSFVKDVAETNVNALDRQHAGHVNSIVPTPASELESNTRTARKGNETEPVMSVLPAISHREHNARMTSGTRRPHEDRRQKPAKRGVAADSMYSEALQDDEYDIPAFLRRNSEH